MLLMTRKMFLQGLAVAVALIGPSLAAPKTSADAASCCATKTRCCDKGQFCCDQPDKAECCKKGVACCDRRPCCGPAKKTTAAGVTCGVTGLPRTACCASKASAMPPCCQQGCEPVKR